MTRILAPTSANVRKVAAHLRDGGIAGIPTETVYGLAANAFDATAVARVFAAKERPSFDPLIVHVAAPSRRRADLGALLEEPGLVDGETLDDVARGRVARLASAFWPGPLTLVLPRGARVPDLVTSGLDSVAIRMPRHPLAQALLRECDVPLAAPSANRFGRISPTSAKDVVAELSGRVPFVLDGGRCSVGVESTVLAISAEGELALLRPGGVPVEEIARVAGIVPRAAARADDGKSPSVAPGMLASHYAPRKPLVLLPSPLAEMHALPPDLPSRERIGLLVVSGASRARRRFRDLAGGRPAHELALSRGGDLREAAMHLFSMLRWLDLREDVEAILAEPPAESAGLGHAIRDRLTRASHRADRSS